MGTTGQLLTTIAKDNNARVAINGSGFYDPTWAGNGAEPLGTIIQNGKIVGAIMQGDLAYGGILQQLIARKIDITKVKKPIFDVDYSDFFHINENFEYYYED